MIRPVDVLLAVLGTLLGLVVGFICLWLSSVGGCPRFLVAVLVVCPVLARVWPDLFT